MTEGIVEQYQNGEHVLGVLERENREEKIFELMMAPNFPKQMKYFNPYSLKA